jgi:hypothetical protein
MADHTLWNRQVCEAQKRGRQVNCHTPGPRRSREQLKTEMEKTFGLRYTDEFLVDPPWV